MSDSETVKGLHGPMVRRRMESGEGSLNFWIAASVSARMRSSSWTHVSGGSPPSFFDMDMDPRVGAKRTPISAAAPNCRAGMSMVREAG